MNRPMSASLSATLAAVALLVPALSIAGQNTEQLSAKLKGKNEVPGPGDPNGKGEIFVAVKPPKGKVCFQLEFSRIQDPSAGHIHRGADDVAGPIKVELFSDPAGIPGPTAEACVKDLKRKLLKKIANRPERFYVNLHNTSYPDGAIRGQLGPAL